MTSTLPLPAGPISHHAVDLLVGRSFGHIGSEPPLPDDPFDLDAQLAWFMLNETSFGGWTDVDEAVEWSPEVVQFRRHLESWFRRTMQVRLADRPDDTPAEEVERALTAEGPGMSAWLRDHGTESHVRESMMLRYPYQYKEADPHTLAIPRLTGSVKRALSEIQSGEYGVGYRSTHAELFTAGARAMGVPADPTTVFDQLPGVAFATSNLVCMGGLSRALRGVVIGQLALFEMDSVSPNGAMVQACDRLGLPRATRRFFDVHVMADEDHQVIARQSFLYDFPALEPEQAGNVVFGVRAQAEIDSGLARHAIGAWSRSSTALRSTPHGMGVADAA